MSREMDERVARAMGWHWDDDWGCLILPQQTAKPCEMWTDWEYDEDADAYVRRPTSGTVSGVVYNGNFTKIVLPEYSTGIAAARQMEDWIEEHGSPLRYARAMLGRVFILEPDPVPDCDEQLWWMLLHATPEQRCRAFLAAMEAHNE